MFEIKTKKVTRWFLIVNEEKIPFRTKKLAITWGKNANKVVGCKVQLYEEYTLFDVSKSPTTFLRTETFDRTSLIK